MMTITNGLNTIYQREPRHAFSFKKHDRTDKLKTININMSSISIPIAIAIAVFRIDALLQLYWSRCDRYTLFQLMIEMMLSFAIDLSIFHVFDCIKPNLLRVFVLCIQHTTIQSIIIVRSRKQI